MGATGASPTQWNEDDKRNAVALYGVYGKANKVAKMTGIPRETINYWRKQDWWIPMMAEIQPQIDEYIQERVRRTITKAYDQLDKRLDEGDPHLHQGEVVYLPVKARDAAWIAAVNVDKRQLLSSRPTSISGADKTQQMLEGVAEFMKQISKDRRQEKEIEAEVVSEQ